MATLKNLKDDVFIILDLKKTKETPPWIGYTLKVLIKKENQTNEFLRLSCIDELYFDGFLEPEIPALCKALNLLTKNEISSYVFEPIDEKDFRLEITREKDFYRMNLFMQEAMLLNIYPWEVYPMIGLQMKVGGDEIINFSNELRKEHSKIVEEYNK